MATQTKYTREEVYQRVRDVLVEGVGVGEADIAPEKRMKTDFDIDSLDLVQFGIELEEEFQLPNEIESRIFPYEWAGYNNQDLYHHTRGLTEQGVTEFRTAYTHIAPQGVRRSMTRLQLESLVTVDSVVNYIVGELNTQHD